MQATQSEPKRDPLASLRIDRSAPSARGRAGGRFWRFLFALLLFLVTAAGGVALALKAGWLSTASAPQWMELPDILKNRPEVRLTRVVVESGRAADATVVATGYLESRRQAKIGARAVGRVEDVFVEEGSKVEKNQVLAVLEHADLDASLAAMEANVARAKAALAEQKITIEQAMREYERVKTLLASRSISETEFDQAKFGHQGAVARLESLKADLALAEARLREANQLKENMYIRAPFNGTVISKDAEVGESIMPGGMGEASGRGSAVTIADLEHLEVDCDVKEDYISRIAEGVAAEVAVDAVPRQRYHGVVRKTIPMGDRARATIKVKVEITDVDERLFPDMSSTVYFLPENQVTGQVSEQPRVFCPTDAIVAGPDGSFVWIPDEKEHVQPRPVTTGAARDGRTEILEGLSGSERIVSKPPPGLVADQAVIILE